MIVKILVCTDKPFPEPCGCFFAKRVKPLRQGHFILQSSTTWVSHGNCDCERTVTIFSCVKYLAVIMYVCIYIYNVCICIYKKRTRNPAEAISPTFNCS